MDSLKIYKLFLKLYFIRLKNFLKTERGRAVIVILFLIWIFLINKPLWGWILEDNFYENHGMGLIIGWLVSLVCTVIALAFIAFILVVLFAISMKLYLYIKNGTL